MNVFEYYAAFHSLQSCVQHICSRSVSTRHRHASLPPKSPIAPLIPFDCHCYNPNLTLFLAEAQRGTETVASMEKMNAISKLYGGHVRFTNQKYISRSNARSMHCIHYDDWRGERLRIKFDQMTTTNIQITTPAVPPGWMTHIVLYLLGTVVLQLHYTLFNRSVMKRRYTNV